MIRVITPPTPPAITALLSVHDGSTSVDTIKDDLTTPNVHALLQVQFINIVILNPSLEVPPLLVVVLVDPLCVSVAAVMSLECCGMGLEVV